jgi:coenzyme PQQ precursor peptide PqqA
LQAAAEFPIRLPDVPDWKNSIALICAVSLYPVWDGGALSPVPAYGGNKKMKIWNKPQVREQEVGLEVTSYMPAEIDII